MTEELHKIRVYPEATSKPGIAENLIIEIDGQKMNGIVEFSYEVKPGQLPVVRIAMVANTSIDAHSTVSKTVDNGMDGVSY